MAMQGKETGMIEPLMKIALNESNPPGQRATAIEAVGQTGILAEKQSPVLEKIREQDKNEWIQEATTWAIVNIGSVEAVPILLKAVDKDYDESMVRFFHMEDRARSAGPSLRKYLIGSDWDKREGVARLMGFIDYRGANDELIQLLDNREDWQVVLVATIGMGFGEALVSRCQESGGAGDRDHPGESAWHPCKNREGFSRRLILKRECRNRDRLSA